MGKVNYTVVNPDLAASVPHVPMVQRPMRTVNNSPLHQHEEPARWEYAGPSAKAQGYDLWRCTRRGCEASMILERRDSGRPEPRAPQV